MKRAISQINIGRCLAFVLPITLLMLPVRGRCNELRIESLGGCRIALEDEDLPGAPMLQPVLRGGRLASDRPGLETIRAYTRRAVDGLPEGLLRGSGAGAVTRRSPALETLRSETMARLAVGTTS